MASHIIAGELKIKNNIQHATGKLWSTIIRSQTWFQTPGNSIIVRSYRTTNLKKINKDKPGCMGHTQACRPTYSCLHLLVSQVKHTESCYHLACFYMGNKTNLSLQNTFHENNHFHIWNYCTRHMKCHSEKIQKGNQQGNKIHQMLMNKQKASSHFCRLICNYYTHKHHE